MPKRKTGAKKTRQRARKKAEPSSVALSSDQNAWCLEYNQHVGKLIVEGAEAEAVPQGRFVFFAAFDGTNNDRDSLGDNCQSTNVAQLWEQYEEKQATLDYLKGRYYAGLGTGEKQWTETWHPTAVTKGVIATAENAYEDFANSVSEYRKLKKRAGPVTVVLTAFSRGVASAAIFSQLTYEKGVVDPAGKVLVKPGKVPVAAAVLFDPVVTGVKGNQAFPPNVSNAIAIRALSEFRTKFRAVDYSPQRGIVKTYGMYGNHCDIGGGYDNGLAAVSLDAATRFLQKSGLPIADVPAERELIPDPGKKRKRKAGKRRCPDQVVIHREESDQDDRVKWSTDQNWFSFEADARLTDSDVVIKPATGASFELYDGRRIKV